MAKTSRDEVLVQLDRVDTALESGGGDAAQVLREAGDWLSAQGDIEPADALYYRERLQAIRERHGA
ncbi:hypothetical protein [Luteimonas saliphila]|uniref:hypothetical protein n=1 Tax=Luteimonas saliphila TaxID=2804919 RepID=UPI00192D234D|nr:hypothetical protein [Luteimonas saliphila]